jgi:hypothetical protein
MRRLIFCVLVFASLPIAAQDPRFYLGVNSAGVWNSYLFRHKDAYVLEGRPNWSVGFQSKYIVSKKVQLDAQLNLASKNFGSGIDDSYYRSIDPSDPLLNPGDSHWAVRQNYLEVPISLNYFFLAESRVKVFGTAGLTNSFFLSAKYAGNPMQLSLNSNGDVFEKYKSYLLSLRTGAGIMFSMGKDFYGTVECYDNVYLGRVNSIKGNPFQLALGFSVLKKLGTNPS